MSDVDDSPVADGLRGSPKETVTERSGVEASGFDSHPRRFSLNLLLAFSQYYCGMNLRSRAEPESRNQSMPLDHFFTLRRRANIDAMLHVQSNWYHHR